MSLKVLYNSLRYELYSAFNKKIKLEDIYVVQGHYALNVVYGVKFMEAEYSKRLVFVVGFFYKEQFYIYDLELPDNMVPTILLYSDICNENKHNLLFNRHLYKASNFKVVRKFKMLNIKENHPELFL